VDSGRAAGVTTEESKEVRDLKADSAQLALGKVQAPCGASWRFRARNRQRQRRYRLGAAACAGVIDE